MGWTCPPQSTPWRHPCNRDCNVDQDSRVLSGILMALDRGDVATLDRGPLKLVYRVRHGIVYSESSSFVCCKPIQQVFCTFFLVLSLHALLMSFSKLHNCCFRTSSNICNLLLPLVGFPFSLPRLQSNSSCRKTSNDVTVLQSEWSNLGMLYQKTLLCHQDLTNFGTISLLNSTTRKSCVSKLTVWP